MKTPLDHGRVPVPECDALSDLRSPKAQTTDAAVHPTVVPSQVVLGKTRPLVPLRTLGLTPRTNTRCIQRSRKLSQ